MNLSNFITNLALQLANGDLSKLAPNAISITQTLVGDPIKGVQEYRASFKLLLKDPSINAEKIQACIDLCDSYLRAQNAYNDTET